MQGRLGKLRVGVLLLTAALGAGCITVVTPGGSPLTTPLPTVASTTPGVTPTPNVSETPTAGASATPTVEPTRTPKPRRTREPRPTPTPAPTTDVTPPIPTPEPVPQATLNPLAPDRYGYVFLASGVFDDPNTVAITSGGPVDARYRGQHCSGFAAIAVDYRVAFSQADPPLAPSSLLRFYFVGPRDTSLIVARGDYGTGANRRWFCADDSFGTFNPTYDFHDPPSGIYHVWVASAESGDYVPGTLFVTTDIANHP